MTSAWSEHLIAGAISRQLLQRRCIVLVDNCNWTGHECDVLGVTLDLRIIDIEVKISRADLKADAAKDKWWHRQPWSQWASVQREEPPRTPREWPPRVWKHYYALPADIWKPELLAALPSPRSGVLLLRQHDSKTKPVTITCERRATPAPDAYRLKPGQAIDVARLANLRMWDAYKELDLARGLVTAS